MTLNIVINNPGLTKTQKTKMMKNLIELKKIILSGSASLDENSKLELHQLFTKVIIEITSESKLSDPVASEILKETLSQFISSGLVIDILKNVAISDFENLGNVLLKEIDKGNIQIKEVIHEYLNLYRFSEILTKVEDRDKSALLLSKLIKKSNYTLDVLFEQRLRDYKDKPLLNIILNGIVISQDWKEVAKYINKWKTAISEAISRFNQGEAHLALLMENSLDMAHIDLACLTCGFVNVMIPANSVQQHISYILNQTKVPLLILSDEKQLSKIKMIKEELLYVQEVVLLRGTSAETWVITKDKFLKKQSDSGTELIQQLKTNLSTDSAATIMYTSGTTGDPKGIVFSQMNIVYKRFCRALAIPVINSEDRYLAYLPLFHTFGRYLELLGSVFWAAEYTFMENPSLQAMLKNMEIIKPTIFVSIPQKWIQLYEHIGSSVDLEMAGEIEISNRVRMVTGGALKWGLSAAGFLPPEIFYFFQKNKIELMSGFGMTEATGGITMTPPGRYKLNSLGRALPGIEIKVADDGELLIRGDYVMKGYFDQKKEEVFDAEDWFATGDIMEMDEEGFIEIIDRKKEIYKNVKGETIAPQKVEKLFKDFDAVHQVFLVGDNRPFNTVLIKPNLEYINSYITQMNQEQINDYYSSLIVTVNNFLAPFERIVDYRLIDRNLSADHGEITPKGTFKRRVIEKNFSELIDTMYQKNHTDVMLGSVTVRIPNWFLREKGCLSGDIHAKGNYLSLKKQPEKILIKKLSDSEIQIGCFIYSYAEKKLDLQSFLTNANLWIGNKSFVLFTSEAIVQWYRDHAKNSDIQFKSQIDVQHDNTDYLNRLKKITSAGEDSLMGLHYAVTLLRSKEVAAYSASIEYFNHAVQNTNSSNYFSILKILSEPNYSPDIEVNRALFKILIPYLKPNNFIETLNRFLIKNPAFIDQSIITEMVNKGKKIISIEALEKLLRSEAQKFVKSGQDFSAYDSMLDLIVERGRNHPTSYEKLRQILVDFQLNEDYPELAQRAASSRKTLRDVFRTWIGPNNNVAVDLETNEEYTWDDVIIIDEEIPENNAQIIKQTIKELPILREAIFLFYKGKIIHLNNILPGGIWVNQLRSYENKDVYRVTVQTRFQGSFEVLLNFNKGRENHEVLDEINLLIIAGNKLYPQELVEDFGGYWEDNDVWSSSYITGDSVEKHFAREIRKNDELSKQRLEMIWPFFIWNACSSYINFWKLTGLKFVLTDPSPSNFIIAPHDYQSGSKIISLSQRNEFKSIMDLFSHFYNLFIVGFENKFPFIKNEKVWNYIFAGSITSLGEVEGKVVLQEFKAELKQKKELKGNKEILKLLDAFLKKIDQSLFSPKELYFAIKRYYRWSLLNPDADYKAQAEMINELYETYRINELEAQYPKSRTRLFLETVFMNSSKEMTDAISEIFIRYHKSEISKEVMLGLITNLQIKHNLTEREKYFLTRLTFPHLKPSDSAELINIKTDGKHSLNLVIEQEDYDGNIFYIRNPFTPKEISRLHQLFIESNLLVNFRKEHQYLIAISERGYIIGGLFYSHLDSSTVHMEKIVVANRYRKKGISDKLMNEFFNRMESENFKQITTGFFRPEYFYRFDFKVERKYSGLVKFLSKSEEK